MDLQKTIADLDAQAAQYTEAANALRALLGNSGSQPTTAKVAGAIKPVPKKAQAKKMVAASAALFFYGRKLATKSPLRLKLVTPNKALAEAQAQPQAQEHGQHYNA